MLQNSEEVSQAGETGPTSRGPRKVGKAAKQRKTDAFRRKVGSKQLQERREEVMKRLGVFDNSCAELEKSLAEMHISVQPTAIPVTVATRGVGFAAAVEYSRMATTWNLAAIIEICTIHQYYRVALYLVYYKLYLARYEQGEMESFDVVTPFTLNEEIRQVLAPVTQTPISTYNILSSVGKVEGSCVWHSVPVQAAAENGEQMALYLYPSNIRGYLVNLSDQEFNPDIRDRFHELNPLPGSVWVQRDGHWLLTNADDIWPANYGANELQADVHAYCNVLTRVSGRLPPSFISSFTWSGVASKSALASLDPSPMSLTASFVQGAVVDRNLRRRNAQGRPVEVVAAVPGQRTYTGDVLNGRANVVQVWTPEGDVSPMELTVGAASLVGEQSESPTRLQIQGRKTAHISPGVILYRLVDAPRSRT